MSKKNNKIFRFWISFFRVIRYGFENFIRNIWLSLAAIIVMVLTLVILFLSVISNKILANVVTEVKQKVDISIYIKSSAEEKDIKEIKQKLLNLENVEQVEYLSSEDSRKEFALKNSNDNDILKALSESTNQFPGIFRVKVKDLNNIFQLENLIDDDEQIKNNIDPDNEPSLFDHTSRDMLDNISKYANAVEKFGIGAVAIFTTMAILVMFNTIRMAIFNYKNQIYMMRLIGAKKWFIRAPFVVEALISGILSAIIATGIGYYLLIILNNKAISWLGGDSKSIVDTIDLINQKWYFALISMIFIGSVICVFSSLIATRKYLKNKK